MALKTPKPGRKPRLPPIIRLPRLRPSKKPEQSQPAAPPAPTHDPAQLSLFPPEGGGSPVDAQGKAVAASAVETFVFRSRRLQPMIEVCRTDGKF